MTSLYRKFHQRTTSGDVKEDWWALVFETDANRLYVEHSWSHANIWKPAKSRHGSKQIDINEFLASGDPLARTDLARLLRRLFDKGDAGHTRT